MARLAWLGLGAMGQRMARRLRDAGHEVIVWNRTPAAAQALVAVGARSAASPRAAADGADVVWSMVYDDPASRSVWLDPTHGAAAALSPDAIAIESSTLSPPWVAELGAAVTARGAHFIDAPVAGSRPQADAGQLIFMVGGETAVIERVRPLLAALGGAVHHVGPVGSGAWLKLTVNALFATQVAAVAEQLGLLRSAGLDVAKALEALRAMPVMSGAASGAGQLMLAGNYAPQAPVDLIAKDLRYAVESGQRAGVALPVTATVKQRLEAAQAAGFGGENIVALAKLSVPSA
jgi:3-hydroxyisobutyrate dehydrogenase